MLTLRRVNQTLRERGIDAELVRGEGYLYLSGPGVEHAEEAGVYGVHRLNDLTLEQWVGIAADRASESRRRFIQFLEGRTE